MVSTMVLNCMVDFPVGPWLLLSPDPQAKLTAKSRKTFLILGVNAENLNK